MSFSAAHHSRIPRVLVIDDEEDLVHLIRYNLSSENMEVRCAYNGTEAIEAACSFLPDVVVLDLMLPDTPGLVLCKQIKQELSSLAQRTPRVIMLTARSSERDRIAGFEAGADDYVTKPFSPRELVLRVKAMLDRGANAPTGTSTELVLGPIRINQEAYQVSVDGQEITLTPIEYKILVTLALHSNAVRTREQLLADVWENAATEILDRTVDAHVKRLRSKLLSARDFLQTVRGVGYCLKISAPTRSGQ